MITVLCWDAQEVLWLVFSLQLLWEKPLTGRSTAGGTVWEQTPISQDLKTNNEHQRGQRTEGGALLSSISHTFCFINTTRFHLQNRFNRTGFLCPLLSLSWNPMQGHEGRCCIPKCVRTWFIIKRGLIQLKKSVSISTHSGSTDGFYDVIFSATPFLQPISWFVNIMWLITHIRASSIRQRKAQVDFTLLKLPKNRHH